MIPGMSHKGCFVVTEASFFLSLSLPSKQVSCEVCGLQLVQGFNGVIRNTRHRPRTTPQLPCLDQVYYNTCGSPQPPLPKQIVPGDWLVQSISLHLHRCTNKVNIMLSFISFFSHHLHVIRRIVSAAFFNTAHSRHIKKVTNLCSFTPNSPWT